MVKNSLKLKKVNSEAQALLTVKDKRKQAKIKILKSNHKVEKVLEEHLVKDKSKKQKIKKKGILGTLASLEESLKGIDCEDVEEKEVKSRLSKKEKSMIE